MSDLRMPQLNTLAISGCLTRDPEQRVTPSGTAIAKFAIANDYGFKDKRTTTFLECTAFGKTAEYVGEHCAKGRPVIVEGRIEQQTWDDKTTGEKRSKLCVVVQNVHLLDWKPDEGKAEAEHKAGVATKVDAMTDGGAPDDLPF